MPKLISENGERRLKEVMALYPDARSAAMAALYIAQEELKVLDERAVAWVSERLGMSAIQVQELISFYGMYHSRPVGRYHVQVCRTLSCAVLGGKFIAEYIFNRFGTKPGEVSANGMWSLEEVECLGSCGTAPVCLINDCLFEKLTAEKFRLIVDRIEKEKPDLSLSTVRDELGGGLKGYPRSEVL